ncbi:MAG: class I tRNA ligase family protein, partial [Parcubacteria group bacterium]
MEKYEPKEIEPKWQKKWAENPDNFSAKDDSEQEKAFILDMFPYPSGTGLHVGHVEGYTASDIYSRYTRMNGKNVLHPIGWDAFGLPAENYAIKTGVHPKITTQEAVETFTHQMNAMGFSYDWSREVNSSDPEYYKWTQWLFLLFYKNGLAYKKKAKVNWCPKCQTVLANEQAENGKCERCESEVIQKDLEQWFFKITDFIEDRPHPNPLLIKERGLTSGLLSGLEKIDWPNSTKSLQKNWIGRSEGAQFKMSIVIASEAKQSRDVEINTKIATSLSAPRNDMYIEVYTTRLDTVFGMTYAVVAPEHSVIKEQRSMIKNIEEIDAYVEDSKKKTDLDRMEAKVKTGVEIKGIKVINPFNGEALPLFVADYVLSQYGTGAVMAVPAHDERDFEFAKKYGLPIKEVIMPIFGESHDGAVKRETVSPLIQRKSDGKFLFLKMKGELNGVITTIIGGIEEGESIESAAIRETLEETGYETKFIGKLGEKLESHFYAPHKKVWRERIDQPVILELINENMVQEISDKEKDLQEIIWLTEEESYKKLIYESDIIRMNRFLGKATAYTDDGRVINSKEYSNLTSAEAREKLTAWLEEKKIGQRKIN